MKKWYKGDTHLHTTNSDGKLSEEKLISECKRISLDYMIITDHNYNTVVESYCDDDILVIQGQELTSDLGHVNIWGKKVPHDPPHSLDTMDDYSSLVEECKQVGAVISLNHPFCSNCPFRMEKEKFPFDTVEVWNTIQHSDNLNNIKWWSEQLLQGNRIMAVGGSDFHKNYVFIPLLASPTTYVLAEEKTTEAILKSLREGRSFVTNSPKSSELYITVGEAQIGDTVRLNDFDILQIRATKLKKGHKLVVYNNDKVIFRFTADKYYKEYIAKVKIEQKGFVRAQIDYKLNPVLSRIVASAEHIFLGSRGVKTTNKTMPELFWAFTNPIWIE